MTDDTPWVGYAAGQDTERFRQKGRHPIRVCEAAYGAYNLCIDIAKCNKNGRLPIAISVSKYTFLRYSDSESDEALADFSAGNSPEPHTAQLENSSDIIDITLGKSP